MIEYSEFLIKVKALIENGSRSYGFHTDEIFSDLAEMHWNL